MARVQDNPERSVSTATLRWHLVLLGVSGIALSLASGWTTWDGMSNFTHNPVLSFLITFGIQSVMLISAWMIGETLAARPAPGGGPKRARRRLQETPPDVLAADDPVPEPKLGPRGSTWLMAIGLAACVAFFSQPLPVDLTGMPLIRYGLIAATVLAAIILARRAFHGVGLGHLIKPYERSVASIFSNLPLWLMFLVCLSASVFFSFDSLFDKIYSATDREAASRSRLQAHVSGLLADLREDLETQRRDSVAALLETPQWQGFESSFAAASADLDSVRADIETRQAGEAEANNARIAKETERLASARAELEVVDNGIAKAEAELRRVDEELAAARPEERRLDLALTSKRFQAEQKAGQAEAEAAGRGVTQMVGKGHRYRELKSEEAALKIEAESLAADLATARRLVERLEADRLGKADDLSKLQAQHSEISSRIARSEWELRSASPSGQLPDDRFAGAGPAMAELGKARAVFLNRPGRQTYAAFDSRCTAASDMIRSIAGGNVQSAGIACGEIAGNKALVGIFEANDALARFENGCGAGGNLSGLSADALFESGQGCIRASGLNSEAASGYLAKLRKVALRRDDRAHRFVVTWNAFFDMNPLAFVALFIALSIDGLVFISGLFGANAEVSLRLVRVRGPPRGKDRPLPDRDSDAILDLALLPEMAATARGVLDRLVPAPLGSASGLAGEIDLAHVEPENADRLRRVLNTACALGMAERRDGDETYSVKTKLVEHLAHRLGWQPGTAAGVWVESKPEELLGVALGSRRREVTACLLEHAEPVFGEAGYVYSVDVFDCPQSMQSRIAGVLNAAVAAGTVAGDPEGHRRYLLTAAFVSMLTRLAASEPETVARQYPTEQSHAETLPAAPVVTDASAVVDAEADTVSSGPVPERRPPKASEGPATGSVQESGQRVPEKPVTSKLIAFPIDTKSRQVAQPVQPRGEDERTGQDEAGLLDKAVDELVSGTGIERQTAIGWYRAGPGRAELAAWSLIEKVRQCDDEFDTVIGRYEKSVHLKLDLFRRTLQGDDKPLARADEAAVSGDDPVSRLLRPYLLRRHAIDAVLNWCLRTLTELETSTLLEGGDAADRIHLQLILEAVERISPLDPDRGHEWSEISLRAGGLERKQECDFEAFSDLMP